MRFLQIASAVLVVAGAGYPAFAHAETGEIYNRVVSSGALRCGYAISPPNLIKDPNTGALSGLDVELWEAVGKELGVKIEWAEEAGWGNFIEGLRTGRYDAFCSMLWPDPARSKFVTMTNPVMYSTLQTYVRADDHRFDQDVEKLNDPSITLPAVEGDVSVTMAQNRFPKAKIYTLPQTATLSEMFMAVTSKKADAMFLDGAMFSDLDKNNKGALRVLKGQPDPFTFASYYGVRSGEFQLRDMLNVAFRTLIDNGQLERTAQKYSKEYKAPKKNF